MGSTLTRYNPAYPTVEVAEAPSFADMPPATVPVRQPPPVLVVRELPPVDASVDADPRYELVLPPSGPDRERSLGERLGIALRYAVNGQVANADPMSAAIIDGGTPNDPPFPATQTISILTTAINGVTSGRYPPDWEHGLQWTPEDCFSSSLFPLCPTERVDKAVQASPAVAEAFPTIAYVGISDVCGPWETGDAGYARASRTLDRLTSLKVARYLHAGDGEAGNPTPTLQNSATLVAGTQTPISAFGVLAQAREVAGFGPGVFHVPAVALPAFLYYQLVTLAGTRYVGPNNWPVITGPGYPTTGPDGEAAAPAGSAYIYVSGPVDYGVGDIRAALSPQLDGARARQNRSDSLAERPIITRVDPCGVFATLTDVTP